MNRRPTTTPAISSENGEPFRSDVVSGWRLGQRMRDGEPLIMRPRYCGMPHRATDGLPVAHRCRVLPADAIVAEFRGHTDLALRLFATEAAAGQLKPHPGVWKHRRR